MARQRKIEGARTLMHLAGLLLACSLHPDDALLTAIVDAFSAGNPYTVLNVNLSVLDSQDDPLSMDDPPRSLEGARAALAGIVAAGGAPILGLLPVRPTWGEEFGKSLEQLFEPCTNVAIASAKLSEFDYECRSRAQPPVAAARHACALERYGASVGLPALRSVILAALSGPKSASDTDIDISDAFAEIPTSSSLSSQGLFFAVRPSTDDLPGSSSPPLPLTPPPPETPLSEPARTPSDELRVSH